MFTFRTLRKTYLTVLLTLFVTSQAKGQFPWQKPMKRDPAEIKRTSNTSGWPRKGASIFSSSSNASSWLPSSSQPWAAVRCMESGWLEWFHGGET